MYTATVCVVSAALILVLASIVFAATVAAMTISYGVKRASSVLWSFCHGRTGAALLEARLLPRLALRRAR